MRHYEIVYLISNANNHCAAQFAIETKSFVTANGGTLQRYEIWGERHLAFKINNLNTAFYYCLNIGCSGQLITKLEEKLRITGVILRHLIVRLKSRPIGKSIFLLNLETYHSNKRNEKKD